MTNIRIFYIKTIILFIVSINTRSMSQPIWVKNNFTEYFKDKFIFKIEMQDDDKWILAWDGLYKIHNNDIEKYYIDEGSKGDLDDYRRNNNKNYYCEINEMVQKNNTIWMFERKSSTFLKIENNFIKNIKPNLKNILYYDFNTNNEIYVVFSEFLTNSTNTSFSKYTICKFQDDNRIDTIKYFNLNNEKERVFDLKIIKNEVYLLIQKNISNTSKEIEIVLLDSLSNRKIIGEEDINSSHLSKVVENHLFILSTEGILYKVQNTSLIKSFFVPKSNINFPFDFFITDNNLFITNSKGLYIEKIDSTVSDFLGKGELKDNKIVSFLHLALNSSENEIWITHQLLVRNVLKGYYGFSILKLTN